MQVGEADGALSVWCGKEDVQVRVVLLLLFSVTCECWGKGIFFRTEEEVNKTLQRAELKSLMYKRMSRNLYSMNSLRSRNPNEMFEQVMRDRCVRLLEVSVLFFDSRKF